MSLLFCYVFVFGGCVAAGCSAFVLMVTGLFPDSDDCFVASVMTNHHCSGCCCCNVDWWVLEIVSYELHPITSISLQSN